MNKCNCSIGTSAIRGTHATTCPCSYENLQNTIKELQSELSVKDQEIGKARAAIIHWQMKYDNEVIAHDSDSGMAQMEIARLKEENTGLKEALDKQQEELSLNQKMVDTQVDMLMEKSDEVDSLKAELETQDKVVELQNKQIADFKALIHTQADALTDAKAEIARLKEDVKKYRIAINNNRSDIQKIG